MIDRSFQSLIDPGSATHYFEFPAKAPLRFDSFHRPTARFLAELSRLVYQPREEIRRFALQSVGWAEVAYVERNFTAVGLFRANDPRHARSPVAVFRGSRALSDWITNLDAMRSEWLTGGRAHRGFQNALSLVFGELLAHATPLGERLVFAGHSLGGALAILAGSLAETSAVYSFGAPRVGDRSFRDHYPDHYPAYRVVNHLDMIPLLPPAMGNDPYFHVGQVIQLGEGEEGIQITPKDLLRALLPGDRNPIAMAPRRLADHSPINYVTRLAPDAAHQPHDSHT